MKKYILFLLVIVSVMFTSCAPVDKEYTWKTISKIDAFNFIHYTNGVHAQFGPEMTSDPYCVPDIKWVENVYRPFLKDFLSNNGVSSVSNPDNNCVKFSSYGLTVGSILHATGQGPRNTSLAIGFVDYTKAMFVWHSINVFIVHNEFGDLELYYYEPQNGDRVNRDDVDSQWYAFRM
jgi:hypothetical protein